MKKFDKDTVLSAALSVIVITFLTLLVGFLIYLSLHAIYTVDDIRVRILGAWVLVNTVFSFVKGFVSSFKKEDQ